MAEAGADVNIRFQGALFKYLSLPSAAWLLDFELIDNYRRRPDRSGSGGSRQGVGRGAHAGCVRSASQCSDNRFALVTQKRWIQR